MREAPHTAVRRIAGWAVDLADRHPAVASERATLAFVDTLACIVAGIDDPAARNVRTAIARWSGGGATVVGGSESAAPWAALANATAAHALDFDDHEHPGYTHVSAVLVPALLALAQERGVPGRAVVDAYIVGYEAIARIGAALNPAHYARGWHATSTIGCLGAALACARLLRLDAGRTAHALSIATSMAGGSKAQFGTMAKALHAGLAAQGGIQAATFAEAGVTGSFAALDGAIGFATLMASIAPAALDATLVRLGTPLAIVEYGPIVKRHPCCAAAHRTVDGVLALREEHGFRADDVAAVETLVSETTVQALAFDRPRDPMEARFSMPYCVAAALVSGRLAPSDFSPAMIGRAEISDLLPRVTMRLGQRDHHLPVTTRVLLRTGATLEARVEHARGSPHAPLSSAQLAEKFHACTDQRVPDARARERMLTRLRGIGDEADVAALLRFVAEQAQAGRTSRVEGPSDAPCHP